MYVLVVLTVVVLVQILSHHSSWLTIGHGWKGVAASDTRSTLDLKRFQIDEISNCMLIQLEGGSFFSVFALLTVAQAVP